MAVGRAASPFQAQDAAVGRRLLEHGQHIDLIHHHVQLMPGGAGPGRRRLSLQAK